MSDVLMATLIFGGVVSYATYVGVRCEQIRQQIVTIADPAAS
jgi:hypothetical protein